MQLFSLQGSFVIKVNGPDGWSWDPEKVCYFSVIVEILSWGFMFLLLCHISMQLFLILCIVIIIYLNLDIVGKLFKVLL